MAIHQKFGAFFYYQKDICHTHKGKRHKKKSHSGFVIRKCQQNSVPIYLLRAEVFLQGKWKNKSAQTVVLHEKSEETQTDIHSHAQNCTILNKVKGKTIMDFSSKSSWQGVCVLSTDPEKQKANVFFLRPFFATPCQTSSLQTVSGYFFQPITQILLWTKWISPAVAKAARKYGNEKPLRSNSRLWEWKATSWQNVILCGTIKNACSLWQSERQMKRRWICWKI